MSFGTVQAEKMTTESGYSLGAGNASSFKNRIINGNMTIDQRNSGASISTSAVGTQTYSSLDRWAYIVSQASKFTMQQNAGSVTPPAGFTNYLGCTSTAATSISSGDYFQFNQVIEGFNTADLGWGTANAKTVTISFWVYSSLTGTFGGSLRNSAINRSYPFTYNISSANTWEQKSVTIVGDTSGTWLTTNGWGVQLIFSLGMGSTYNGTAGSWASANYASATGATSVVSTNGATFYITGVQFEVGTVATSFDFRSYGTELALCQRYGQMAANANEAGHIGFLNGAQATYWMSYYAPVVFRTTPSATITGSLYPSNYSSNLSTITGVSTVSFIGSVVRVAFSLNSTPAKEACGLNANSGSVFLSAEL